MRDQTDGATMHDLKVGEVAERSGVGVDTVRFYEHRGLIPEPPRTPSGYRQYPEETVERLLFIQRAKALGFTLDEIGELLEIRLDHGVRPADVRRRAEEKLVEVDEKLRALRTMKAELVDACAGAPDPDDCAILAALSEGQPESSPGQEDG